MNLLGLIQERFRNALTDLVSDSAPYVAMVKATQDAKHGDYQANCAMSLFCDTGNVPMRSRNNAASPTMPFAFLITVSTKSPAKSASPSRPGAAASSPARRARARR